MNLYVSNLAYSVTDDDLRNAFAAFGQVSSARVITDRDTGRSRGFGFVDMPDDNEANAAIRGLSDQDFAGRPLRVIEARPKEPRPGGSGGGGGGGGGYKGGGDRGGYKGGGGGGGYKGGGGGGGGGYKGGGGGGYKGGGDRGDRGDRGWKGDRGGRGGRGGDGFGDDGW